LESRGVVPDGTYEFRKQLLANDAFILSSPEYNASTLGALKNAIGYRVFVANRSMSAMHCFCQLHHQWWVAMAKCLEDNINAFMSLVEAAKIILVLKRYG
jgi:hypothetical protein